MSSFAQSGRPNVAQTKLPPLLRRLRLLCTVLAIAAGVLLPFELGAVATPSLASLPVIGGLFPRPVGVLTISNAPYTAVVGQTERFSVQLENQPRVVLVYELYYPDGRVVSAKETADTKGFSSHVFRIEGYRPTQFREEATVGVRGMTGSYRAYLHFAIQQDRPSHRLNPHSN